MKVEKIQSVGDAELFCEGLINDYEGGISDKGEVLGHLGTYTARLMEMFADNAEKKAEQQIKELKELLEFAWKNMYFREPDEELDEMEKRKQALK